MRNIEVSAKTVEQAIEKGLQMLGVNREDIEVKILDEGSMLKKAKVEIYTFANAEEREEYNKKTQKKNEIKLVKTETEEQLVDISEEGVEEATAVVIPFVTKILQALNVDATVSRGVRNGEIYFKINGSNVSRAIGYHGEMLEHIQELTNQVVRTHVKNYYKKIYLDVENYRMKRKDTVEQIAEKMAKKVIENKRSIKLEPMNSFERKAIHACLNGVEHIGTHSEGVEPNRYLVIDYID